MRLLSNIGFDAMYWFPNPTVDAKEVINKVQNGEIAIGLNSEKDSTRLAFWARAESISDWANIKIGMHTAIARRKEVFTQKSGSDFFILVCFWFFAFGGSGQPINPIKLIKTAAALSRAGLSFSVNRAVLGSRTWVTPNFLSGLQPDIWAGIIFPGRGPGHQCNSLSSWKPDKLQLGAPPQAWKKQITQAEGLK